MILLDKLVQYPCDVNQAVRTPNHGRRTARSIDLIVLHGTADKGNEEGSLDWMNNPKSDASCHILFHRDGHTTRLCKDRLKTWHAGESVWRGREWCNGFSLGWEIANREDGKEPITDAQYKALAKAIRWYMAQGMKQDEFTDHRTISPGRKSDPRTLDWDRLWEEVAYPKPRITPCYEV